MASVAWDVHRGSVRIPGWLLTHPSPTPMSLQVMGISQRLCQELRAPPPPSLREEEGAGSSSSGGNLRAHAACSPAPVLRGVHDARMAEALQATFAMASVNEGRMAGAGAATAVSVPELAVALSAAVSRLGCRVVVRRVTDTKQYWSKSLGNAFVICTLPAHGVGSASSSQVGGGLVVDPGLKAQFNTPHMTQRYRCGWADPSCRRADP